MGDNSQKKIQKKNSGQDNETYINMKEEIQLIQNLGDFLGDTKNITTILDKRIQELQKKQKATSAVTSAATPVVQTKNIIRVMNWNIQFDLYYKNFNQKILKTDDKQKEIQKDLSEAIYTQNPDIVCTQEMNLILAKENQKIFDKNKNIFVGQDTDKFKKTYNIVSIDAGKDFLGIVYNNTLFKEVEPKNNNRIAYCPEEIKNQGLTGDINNVELIKNNNTFKNNGKRNCGRGIVSILLEYIKDKKNKKYLGIINVHLPHSNNKNINNIFVKKLETTINTIKTTYYKKVDKKNTKFILLGDFNEYLYYATGNNKNKISGLTLMNNTNEPTLKTPSNQAFDLQYTDLKKKKIQVSQKKIQSDHYYVLSELEFP